MFTCADAFRRHRWWFLGVSVFTVIFAGIYEYFSHGIRSNSMIFAFLYPLLLGFFPTLLLSFIKSLKKIAYNGAARLGVNLFYAGIATVTFGSIAYGVVEIYGTTNHLIDYYYYVGFPLLAVGLLVTAIGLVVKINQVTKEEIGDDASEISFKE